MKTRLFASAALATALLSGGVAVASQPVALKQVARLDAASYALASVDKAVPEKSDAIALEDKSSDDRKLKVDDKRRIEKKAKAIETNARRLIDEAKLTGDKESVAEAEKLFEVDRERLEAALSKGDVADILKTETVVIARQNELQAHLLPQDRRVVLKEQDASPKDEFAVGVLPQFGLANAFPKQVDELKYWVEASNSTKTVDFYSQAGELFTVEPESVLESYKILESIGDGGRASADEILKKAFSVSSELYEKFGDAGLFGEIVFLDSQDKFRGQKADILALDKRLLSTGKPIIGPSGGGAVAGVPEPGVWTMLLVGFGVLGASLRRRRFALAA